MEKRSDTNFLSVTTSVTVNELHSVVRTLISIEFMDDYFLGPCVDFLREQAKSLNLPFVIHYATDARKPIVVLTWMGSEPELPTILLNSHMDVVPVYPETWTHPPFAAEIDDDGRIFARGSQDMKSLGMAYLAAIGRLQRNNFHPRRTIHILFVPDEETGSVDGMKAFVKTPEFQALNIGFALDEGHVSPAENYIFFYGEKTIWQPTFTIHGHPGHGSLLFEHTAGEGFSYIVEKLMHRRQNEVEKVKRGQPIGNVTSINLTKVSGGIQTNVIPEELSVTFDIRLPPTADHEAFNRLLEQWIRESGANVSLTFEQKEDKVPVTPIDDSNPFWMTFRDVLTNLNFTLEPQILAGGTDMRFLRALRIPALGFNPMNHTPLLLHADDEFIYADKYIKAIGVFSRLIEKLTELN
uniref:N-acyl-aliphatic-L-amino acid amidohydrolase n=1 Tax=Lutzomyia longipalpis TaxID=7200 RepID=A0A1B0CTY8_LUTLO